MNNIVRQAINDIRSSFVNECQQQGIPFGPAVVEKTANLVADYIYGYYKQRNFIKQASNWEEDMSLQMKAADLQAHLLDHYQVQNFASLAQKWESGLTGQG
jgi:hypothetical protein